MRGCSFKANAMSVLYVSRVPSRMIFGQSFELMIPSYSASGLTSGSLDRSDFNFAMKDSTISSS
jgi:hypothetical protein